MERSRTHAAPVLFAMAVALVAAGCGSSSYGSSGSTSTATSTSTGSGAVAAAQTGLGSVLVDAQGRTLYVLSADRPGQPACTGACLQAWPPLLTSGTPAAPSGVTATLGVISRGSDSQVTANGMPLYTFSGDSSPGQTNGQGIQSFGGTWSAETAVGAPATGSAPAQTVAPTTGGYHY